VICELIDEGVLFLGQETYKIEIPYSFDTAFLSLMESCVRPAPRTALRLIDSAGTLRTSC
jgi:hypothetical protein